jgi:SAM-dependent methyltransferase
MRLKPFDLSRYLSLAPIPLATERSLECRILAEQTYEHPVLDVGCGDGLFAFALFDEPLDLGIDLDPRELERARQYGIYKELIPCRAETIPKPNGSFRTVLSNSVLEHIPDLEPVLREVNRLLAPGGRFYMTVPSDCFDRYSVGNRVLSALRLKGLAGAYRRWYDSFWKHYHFHSLEVWREVVRGHGFEIVDSFTYAPAGVCTFHDAMVPFSLPGFILKKLINRWTLWPGLRKVLLRPFVPLLDAISRKGGRCENGGLVFMALRKPLSSGAQS